MTAVIVVEGVVIVLLLILVGGLLKSHAEILRKLDRIEGGTAGDSPSRQRPRTTGLGTTPSAELVGVDPGGAATSASLTHGRGETLIAFLSTGCASCRIFWSDFGSDPSLPTQRTRPLIVTKGPQSESPAQVRQLAPAGVKVIMSDEAWDEFRVPLTPYFMLVDGEGGILGEGSATDLRHLNSLFEQSKADNDPMRLDTKGRARFTDQSLSRSGIDPGDPSLYEDPLR